MPEPVPISRTSGAGDEDGKAAWRKAVSEGEESVSRRRKESSAGSYTREYGTWDVSGVGSILSGGVLVEAGRVGVNNERCRGFTWVVGKNKQERERFNEL